MIGEILSLPVGVLIAIVIASDLLADISFVCDFAQFLREGHYEKSLHAQGYKVISSDGLQRYPKAYGHMLKLSERPEFAEIMGGYLNWFRSKQ